MGRPIPRQNPAVWRRSGADPGLGVDFKHAASRLTGIVLPDQCRGRVLQTRGLTLHKTVRRGRCRGERMTRRLRRGGMGRIAAGAGQISYSARTGKSQGLRAGRMRHRSLNAEGFGVLQALHLFRKDVKRPGPRRSGHPFPRGDFTIYGRCPWPELAFGFGSAA
jgi:hypothetical protein